MQVVDAKRLFDVEQNVKNCTKATKKKKMRVFLKQNKIFHCISNLKMKLHRILTLDKNLAARSLAARSFLIECPYLETLLKTKVSNCRIKNSA